MEIRSFFTNRSGQQLPLFYYEDDPMKDLDGKILQAVHAYCFYDDKIVLVHHAKSGLVPVGGHIEEGETPEQTVVREVLEETNMKVLAQKMIGYIDIHEPDRVIRQTRSVCLVEPYGDFVSDPDNGEVSEIKLIDPVDYKQYFDWGEVGDRIMQRAVEMKKNW